MKKLTWCLLPLAGLIVACGGESDVTANTAAPPAVQGPGNVGPNGELQPFQPAISGVPEQPGNGNGNQSCADECRNDADPATCEDNCCSTSEDDCQLCQCLTDKSTCQSQGICN